MKKAAQTKTKRTSVTLSLRDFDDLKRIAAGRRVSVAWLIREAVERYLAAKEPLFRNASD